MMSWSRNRPFCVSTSPATAAALMLLVFAAAAPIRAETSQQATLSDRAKIDTATADSSRPDSIKAAMPGAEKSEQGARAAAGDANQAQPANPTQPKSLT